MLYDSIILSYSIIIFAVDLRSIRPSSIIQYPYPPGTWYCVSCACSGVATTPVPMAQTGS